MISLLIVNYHSAALTIEAIRSARASTASDLQVVVVDNSCDAPQLELLAGHADTLLASPRNLGYAGGINLGRRSCGGDVLVVSNPDVRFRAESLDRLVAVLDERTAVAGPAFSWDDDGHWLLPPSDLHTAWEKLDEVLATRMRSWRVPRDRRRFLARARFWSLQQTTPVRALSGAVMAIRMRDFDELEGFDERFRLYFEETDFLRRLAERRRRIVYVPDARCRHLYNQSAGQIASEAAARYAESELRYLEKWNGPFVGRTLKRLERPVVTAAPIPPGPLLLPRVNRVVVEASPLAGFETAAGFFPDRDSSLLHAGDHVQLPAEVLSSFRGDALYLRAVDRDSGEVLATACAVK